MRITVGARKAITLATGLEQRTISAYDVPRGGGQGRSNLPQVVQGCIWGRILSAIDDQPQLYRDWLYFTYGAPGWQSSGSLRRLTDYLRAWYLERYKRPQRMASFRALIPFIIDDLAHRHRCTRAKYSPEVMCVAVGIKPMAWNSWKWTATRLRSRIDEIDRDGLEPVTAEIARWNEKVRAEQAGEPVAD